MGKDLPRPETINIRKNNKTLRDARLLAIKISSVYRKNKSFCLKCKDTGALLPCSNCTRSFHLCCIGLRETDVPVGSWYCKYCLNISNTRFIKESEKLRKKQQSNKDNRLKQLIKELNSVNSWAYITEFAEQYPQFVKGSKILYPISDEILWNDPILHDLVSFPIRPIPNKHYIDGDSLGDLLKICDFVYKFDEMLELAPFSVDMLFSSLIKREETTLAKNLLISLVRFILNYLVKESLIIDKLQAECPAIKIGIKLYQMLDFDRFLSSCYCHFIFELLRFPLWQDYLTERIIIAIQRREASPDQAFHDLDPQSKLNIIQFLITAILDTQAFHEILQKRNEDKIKCNRRINEINNELRELAQQDGQSKKILGLNKQLRNLNVQVEDLALRNAPLGKDRDYNEYYIFKFDINHMYVLLSGIQIQEPEVQFQPEWRVYSTDQEIQELIQALCAKGIRESHLLRKINHHLPLLHLLNDESTASENMLDEYKTYKNRHVTWDQTIYDLQHVRSLLLKLEKSMDTLLQNKGRLWIQSHEQREWRKKVRTSSDIQDLKDCIFIFVENVHYPIKFGDNESDSESNSSSPSVEAQRVKLSIWKEPRNIYSEFTNLLSETATTGQLFMCVSILETIFNHYMRKRIYVNQEIKHDECCYICDDGGFLMCCESCNRAGHPKCAGLPSIPAGDWFCEPCEKFTDRGRLRKGN